MQSEKKNQKEKEKDSRNNKTKQTLLACIQFNANKHEKSAYDQRDVT